MFNLWENTPGMCEETPTITAYIPNEVKSDGVVIIMPGGGYRLGLAPQNPHVSDWSQRLIDWL